MANISKRPDGRWRARYRDRAGKEHARHFRRKLDAQRWLDSVTTAITTGTYVDPVHAHVTVGDWTDNRVPLPRPVIREHRYLTHVQVEEFAAAAGEHRLVILFLAYTDVRHGEMAALRVRPLDCCDAAR